MSIETKLQRSRLKCSSCGGAAVGSTSGVARLLQSHCKRAVQRLLIDAPRPRRQRRRRAHRKVLAIGDRPDVTVLTLQSQH